jgi:sugar/nucleoside kinase (ribokinase family)
MSSRREPRRWDVLAVGDPCADIVVGADVAPQAGEKVLGRALGEFAGGAEANVACAIARLGRSSAVYGRVGNDVHGSMLCTSLRDFGVDIAPLTVDTANPSVSVIVIVTRSGDRAIVYLPMPPRAPRSDALAAQISEARVVYTMPYSVEELDHINRSAKRSGTLVAIDIEAAVAPNADELSKRVALADIVFFNHSGFEAGTGEPPTEASLSRVLSAGPRVVVVTRGAGGAMAMDQHGFATQQAFPGPVVDTTGAGDTFNAAFLAATLDGEDLQHAVRFGCAAASCTVAAVGARSHMPDRRMVSCVLAQSLGEHRGAR